MGKPLTLKRIERCTAAAMGRYQRLAHRHRAALYSRDPKQADIVARVKRHRDYALRWQRVYIWLETLARDEYDFAKLRYPYYQPPKGVSWGDIALYRVQTNKPADHLPVVHVPGYCTGWGRPFACMAD